MRNAGRMISVCLIAALILAQAEARAGNAVAFEKVVLTGQYYCDGINHGDFNQDGRADIVAGPFWYEGPDYKLKHEFFPAEVFDTAPSPTNSMFSYVYDFNADGWQDILVLGRVHLHEAYWYENPQGKAAHWPKHLAFTRVQGESPPFLDVDGDGKPELVAHWNDRWGLIKPDWNKPNVPWSFVPVTAAGTFHHFYHGTGIGDINGDGRLDLVLNEGWWAQPAPGSAAREWTAHPFKFGGKGGAQIYVYDVNADGKNDVITSLDAHGWGLSWFEQISDNGQSSFREHKIMGDRSEEAKFGAAFSQPHALALADVDGDGLQDIVAGKRRWAHGPKGDVEPMAPPVVYWFQLVRSAGNAASYVPHLVDDNSGAGVQIVVADVNDDKRVDILTVSKLGAFLFRQKPPP